MVQEVIWTQNAEEDFNTILIYLEKEWTKKTSKQFYDEFYHIINLIKIFPTIGIRSTKDERVRRILITKHNALYYKAADEKIILLNIYDTRQDPDKNLYQ